MYHVSAQGVDERMINVHYYYVTVLCDHFFIFSTSSHGQPHAVMGGFISISGELVLLCDEFIMAADSPHITPFNLTMHGNILM